jgi:hypothetical protein
VASGEGSVWIQAGPRVYAVDPGRGDRWRTIFLPRLAFGDQGFDVGYRTVWLRSGAAVERINPATGALLQPTTHPDWIDFGGDIAVGSGGVWVGNRSSIFRLAAQDGGVVGRIDFQGNVDHLAVGEGSLWVADEFAGKVFRIDPRENRPVTVSIEDTGAGISAGETSSKAAKRSGSG